MSSSTVEEVFNVLQVRRKIIAVCSREHTTIVVVMNRRKIFDIHHSQVAP